MRPACAALPAVAHYEAGKGTAVIVVYPPDAYPPDVRHWNVKMFVTAPGGSRAPARGNLKPWDRNRDPADPLRDLSAYERLMLGKGYALGQESLRKLRLLTGSVSDAYLSPAVAWRSER